MKRMGIVMTALALAGCSAIPNSGPVVQGPRVDVVRNDGYVRVIARPPSPGMKPDALVRGFLSACASVADGDDTARKYLTSAASAAWNPSARIDVYDAGALTVTLTRNDTVHITAPLIGTIDSRHRYHVAEPGALMTDDLHVTQVNGEWRIDASPRALFLDQVDVARGFRAHPVYLLNPARTRLVLEYVVLPLSTTNLIAPLARAAVAGLSDGSVATSRVGVTQSLFGYIIGDFGSAIVGLDRRIMGMSVVGRDALIAQLTWTLTALPSVSTVSVQVDGQTLATSDGRTSHSRSEFASFDPTRELSQHTLLYVREAQILSLADGGVRVLHSGTAAAEATMSPDGQTLVAVSASRKLLFTSLAGRSPEFLASGSDLAAPAVLSTGETWFVDREAKGRLLIWDSTTPAQPVDTGLPARARILDFAIAPDEVRIALIINNGATTTVRLGRIVRDAQGVHIVGLARVEQRLTSAVAIAWAGESELGVLGAVGAVAVQPISVSLPLGAVSLIGGPANAVSLAAVPGAPMVVGDQAGQLWEYLDSRWSASELGSAPSYAR